MPSHPCKWPTCSEYVPEPGYCPAHTDKAPADRREQHRRYDQLHRDPEAKSFYNSTAWQRARATKLTTDPLCELCGRLAEHVHHKTPVKASEEKRLEQKNLQSLCQPCHSRIEAKAAAGGA